MGFITTAPRLASAETIAPPQVEDPRTAAPAITYGHSKAHRPDLKQLLLILTMTPTATSPSRFAPPTATPTTRGPTSRPGPRYGPWRAGPISSTSPIRSSAATITWITSTAPAGVSSPCCPAPAGRQEFRKSIQTNTPTWDWSGIVPIRATATDRATSGPSTRALARRKVCPSSGSGARCSRCASRPGVTAISPRPPKRSRPARTASRGETRLRRAAEIDLEIEMILESTTCAATSRSSAQARGTPSSKHTAAAQDPTPSTEDHQAPLRPGMDHGPGRHRLRQKKRWNVSTDMQRRGPHRPRSSRPTRASQPSRNASSRSRPCTKSRRCS